MSETTHTFLESCARLLQDHSCERAASQVLRARPYVPDIPLGQSRLEQSLLAENDILREEEARLRKSNLDLQAVLLHAVTIIKRWHGADLEIPKEDENELWQMYYDNAPEMKPIREALKG